MDDLTSLRREPAATISAQERERRRAAIDYARGSVRLEGFTISPEAEELNRRYVDGEITSAEHSAALLRRHRA